MVINLGRAFDSVPKTVVDRGYVFGNSGQVYQLQGSVAGAGQPFRVTLAWVMHRPDDGQCLCEQS
jgi:hypothetical protein